MTDDFQKPVGESKARSNSMLLKLPEPLQYEIFEKLEATTYDETIRWAWQDRSLKISKHQLEIFYDVMKGRRAQNRRAARVEDKLLDFARRDPTRTPEFMAQLGDYIFTEITLAEEETADYVKIQKLQIDRLKAENDARVIAQTERKLALVEEAAAKARGALGAAKDAASQGLTEETIKRIEEAAKLL